MAAGGCSDAGIDGMAGMEKGVVVVELEGGDISYFGKYREYLNIGPHPLCSGDTKFAQEDGKADYPPLLDHLTYATMAGRNYSFLLSDCLCLLDF